MYAILRYLSITPQLQKLYASEATAEHITWHANHQTEEGSMCYPTNPLNEELQNLWHVGVLKQDNATNQAFMMHGALIWTVNHLPTYGMVSVWSTTDVIGDQFDHPYHMNKEAFTKNQVQRKVACPKITGKQNRDWVAEFSSAVEVPLILPPGY
ncbi:UNVERIFIED_CONTAM: hypothetical protein Scaly_2440900 [Sesamum calycinum]|uniref:Uncharacterized protein n=1 Tax=Sesamum calycinum TaxID=2727403 RepID=A0AAW2M0Y2_9LAMI